MTDGGENDKRMLSTVTSTSTSERARDTEKEKMKKKKERSNKQSKEDTDTDTVEGDKKKVVIDKKEKKQKKERKEKKQKQKQSTTSTKSDDTTPQASVEDAENFDFDSTLTGVPVVSSKVPVDKELTHQSKRPKRAREEGGRAKRSDGLFPCLEFDKTGACKFGDKCKFSHLGPTDSGKPVKKPKKRNGICLIFVEGTCKYGDKCRYRHVSESERERLAKKIEADKLIATCLKGGTTPEDKLKKIMALPENLRQTARAVFFAKQKTQGFPSKKRPDVPEGAKGRKGVCFAYQKGECNRGDACIFRHDMAIVGK